MLDCKQTSWIDILLNMTALKFLLIEVCLNLHMSEK